LAQKAVSS